MPDTPDFQSVVEAAEQAAAAGDYASAEARLRELARLQEASLGPRHPDLANTLNNLGVVCEVTGRPEDAERCFRQAWAIAAAVLAPDDPFVATSRKNLEDFCAAHGKAVDSPPAPSLAPPHPPAPPSPPPAVAVEPPAPKSGAADRRPEPSSTAAVPQASPRASRAAPRTALPEAPREAPRSVAPRRPSRSFATGALIAAGLLVVFIATATWFRSNDEVQPAAASPGASPPDVAPAAVPSVGPSAPGAPTETATGGGGSPGGEPRRSTTPAPAPGAAGKPSTVPPARNESRPTQASAAQEVAVADARLCRSLLTGQGEWQCVPPGLPTGPGPFVFYTRIRSPNDTTVEHRWYRGDRLHRVVELRIRANMGAGYRTFSRNTISREGAGDWRVELRTQSGELLHEERFVVR